MATGLNIRDFKKAYREVRYENQGSLRLTNIEHNAYLNRLTVEITHYDAYRSVSYKTLPDNTHWGYLTSFKGSSVVNNLAIKFAKQRAYEAINHAIWHYHQSTENISILSSLIQQASNSVLGELSSVADGIGIIGLLINAVEGLENVTEPAFEWLIEQVTGEEFTPDNPGKTYSAYPVASPFPDVFKFLSDVPCSFLFRLESWYLVNPVIYAVSNPIDSEDATDDEGEYPSPDPGNGSGEGASFPPSGAPDPNSDSRDFEPDDGQPGTGTWVFTVSFGDPGNNPFCNQVPAATLQLRGFPDEPPRKEFTGPQVPEGGRPGRFFTSVASAPFGGTCGLSEPGSSTFIPDGPA